MYFNTTFLTAEHRVRRQSLKSETSCERQKFVFGSGFQPKSIRAIRVRLENTF